MFSWFKKRAAPSVADVPGGSKAHHFLQSIRPGPDTRPAGDYAMWFPSPDEPQFAQSETRRNIGQIYDAISGIESFVFADLLRQLGLVGEDVLRVALPDDLTTFPILGSNNQVYILSASPEKGLRLHFHQSATVTYRNFVLAEFVDYATRYRQVISRSGARFDPPRDPESAVWWRLTEQVVASMESTGEPVEAIGKVLLA